MSDSADRDPVEVLAEEFSRRRRLGEQPTIDEYAEAHPRLADRIRRLFPVMLVIDEVAGPGESPSSASGSEKAPYLPQQSTVVQIEAGPPSGTDEEYRKLLRRRMAILGGVSAGVFTLFLTNSLADLNPLLTREQLGVTGLSLFTVTSAAFWLCLFRCLARPELPLKEMRLWEWAGILLAGSTVAYIQWILATTIPAAGFEGPEHARSYMVMLNFARCFEWFVLIVSYGLFVPNPWWRTTAAVLVLSALAVAVIPVAAASSELVRQDSYYLLSWTAAALVTADALSIFGAFKISTLQREVFVARRLGAYQLKRPLGRGGMGEVYLAEHRLLKRPCAVKVIRPEKSGDRHLLSRFEREVQVTARLTHPNTVEIFDYGHTEDGTFYYVMEYLEGHNLEELVREHGRLPPARVIHFARQLCGALHEAHTNGLVHRDIKPSNVIVCRQGGNYDVVKLVDFGLVGTLQADPEAPRLTDCGATLGTPQFMSPEQVRGGDTVDARSDLYSLGGLMFFLLAGRPPFEADSAYAMALAHVERPVPGLRETCPDIPADLESIVRRCLAKNPGERYPDVDCLNKALRDCSCSTHWTESDARAWWSTQGDPAAVGATQRDNPSGPEGSPGSLS